MSHSEQFWPFFLCFGLGLLNIVSNLAVGVRLKFPDMSRDSGRWREMSEDRNKAESKSEGENSDVSPKTPDTETVKDHEVYKSTMQAIRETMVKPVDKKKDR